MYQIFYASPYKKVINGKEVDRQGFKPVDIAPYSQLDELFLNAAKDMKAAGLATTNIYYTLAYHSRGTRSKAAWQMQEFIPYDLDGIDLDRIDQYPPVVCEALGYKLEDATIVHSGNGLQILFKVEQVTNPEFIANNKNNWLRSYEKVEKAIKEAKLPITRDTTAWDYARIFRVPDTINHKKKKLPTGEMVDNIKECKLVQLSKNIVELPFDYAGGESLPNTAMPKGSFGNPDAETILKGCNFFKWLETNPDEVHEPHAYAALSITAHFENQSIGQALYDKFSSPSINTKSFEDFTEQARTTSGPRTCVGVNSVWGKCSTCPHYNKITSPIQLKSDAHIGTQGMGFTVKAGKTLIRDYRGLALHMLSETSFKTCPTSLTVYAFNGSHYDIMSDQMIKAYAENHFSQPVKEKERGEFLNLIMVSNILTVPDEKEFISAKNTEGFINFKNGVLNLRSGDLLPHGKNFHFHYCLPYDYVVGAVAPNWLKFLDQVTLGREDLKNILHEYMGFILFGGEYLYQKALILSGSGKNGKSTFVNILKILTGEGNYSTVSLQSIGTRTFSVAEIQNKLVNISEEEPPSCFKETGVFKNLTGNNTIQAERKFKNPFNFVSRAKVVITYNEVPYISDTSTGMRRRLMIVPFDLDLESTPHLVDVKILDKLKDELSGIFNLAIEGYRRLDDIGRFTKSIAVEDAISEAMDFNPFELWLEENISLSDDLEAHEKCRDVYENYTEYVKGLAEGRLVYSFKKFGMELKKKQVKSSVLMKGTSSIRIYKGISFNKNIDVKARF
jgi:P4 family phage/plasmid primase-like protien